MTAAPALSPEVFAELAGTRPQPTADAALRAALHVRRMLLVKSLLVRVDRRRTALQAPVHRRFEQDWALLERAERTDAAAVRAVVDYPTTGAWLALTLAAPEGPSFERHLAHLGGVAAAAAVLAGCAVGGTLAVPTGALTLPGIGVLRCASGRARLDGEAGLTRITDADGGDGVELSRPDAPGDLCGQRTIGDGSGWSGLRALPGSAVVFDDLDPYRAPLRGVGPSALPPAERPHSAYWRWADAWHAVQALLTATDPARATEVGAVMRAVVPLGPAHPHAGMPVSATLRAAPGAVLTQLPTVPGELMEALVHEVHHTKLAVLDGLVPLCRPGTGGLHRVGWRTDPRPVPAVLQGAYAHLALADLSWRAAHGPAVPTGWRRRAARRFQICRRQVAEALSILRESDELTDAGKEFVRLMATRHAGLGMAARSPA
ncbi:aKG-HExxH-type peptide beta-hydroxylase [Streptomyces sp. NPDC048710]|uniref:aKG-HExxH-type peptide beta-hydroxylase n=1 Tax=unclassified Streptomyces TaxID=2593676 RepID=UPI0037174EDE